MRNCIKSPSPKGFPKPPGAMAGQPGKRGRLFPRRGPTSPLCTGVFSQRGGLVLLPNPAGNGKHKSSHRRKKVGAVSYIPDCMEIQTPRALPNCPERWRDNLGSAGDFSRGEGRLSRYAPAYFCRGAAPSVPQSRMEWENKTPTSFAKGGSSVHKSRTNR